MIVSFQTIHKLSGEKILFDIKYCIKILYILIKY